MGFSWSCCLLVCSLAAVGGPPLGNAFGTIVSALACAAPFVYAWYCLDAREMQLKTENKARSASRRADNQRQRVLEGQGSTASLHRRIASSHAEMMELQSKHRQNHSFVDALNRPWNPHRDEAVLQKATMQFDILSGLNQLAGAINASHEELVRRYHMRYECDN